MNRRDVLLAAVIGIAGLLRGSRAAAGPAPAGSSPAGSSPVGSSPVGSSGVRVVVTKEMLGAGVVSSGVALPPIPPVTAPGARRCRRGESRCRIPSSSPTDATTAWWRSRRTIWQYGVTDRKGHAAGYLNYPDGFDVDVFRDWKGALGAKP